MSTVLDEIAKALSDGDRVELRGFGAFSVKVRPARQGRNPRTGEAVAVHEKRVPFFRTGKEYSRAPQRRLWPLRRESIHRPRRCSCRHRRGDHRGRQPAKRHLQP